MGKDGFPVFMSPREIIWFTLLLPGRPVMSNLRPASLFVLPSLPTQLNKVKYQKVCSKEIQRFLLLKKGLVEKLYKS